MLRVSDNRRFLVRGDGRPFFYLGDTAWALFQRLDLAESQRYLADRAAKGFTVIQMDGEPNYEDTPVHMRPENGYFSAYDARKVAYWALFAGAHGHTYGANGVFQFWNGADRDVFSPRLP